ncbi:MAG TPA: sialidase family protein [Solirubrobacteraceae bacterium]|jgi:hypothetical protein
MRALSILVALTALALLPASASAADRSGTVTGTQPFQWDTPPNVGANANYDGPSGEPCGHTPDAQCDTTLLHVDAGAFFQSHAGGMQVDAGDFTIPTSDFDLYVYESDAAGTRGRLVASSGGVPGNEESTTVPDVDPTGYYLVQVIYFAVTGSGYHGSAKLVSHKRFPFDIDDPTGVPDVLASNPDLGYRSHSEPHLAQSPVDPNLLIAGSKMYNRDRDSLDEYEFKIGTYVSFDGGKTWHDMGQIDTCPASQAGPDTWPNNTCYPEDDPSKGGTGPEDVKDPDADPPDTAFDDRGDGDFAEEYITSDIWMQFDDEGNAYAMVLDSPPFESGNGWGMTLHKWETPSAADLEAGGKTWGPRVPINAYTDGARQMLFLDDKNTFAVNNAGPDHDGKTGTIIACWGQQLPDILKQQVACDRSTDAGQSFPGEPVPISDVQQLVIGVHVLADPQDPDTFYATWLQYATGTVGPSTLEVARTTDGGQTWTHNPTPVATLEGLPTTYPGQGFRNLSIPIAAVGPKSELYITYPEYRPAPKPDEDADGRQGDIMLVKSTDGGQSFTDPVVVNQDGGNADQFQQSIAVAPNGQVNVTYFDRRLDHPSTEPDGFKDEGNYFIDLYLSRSADFGATFEDVRLSHDAWDPAINPPTSPSGAFIGDYQGLVADNDHAVAFYNDTHRANDPSRDPDIDPDGTRSQFQQAIAWRIPNTAAFGGGVTPGTPGSTVPPGGVRGPVACAASAGFRRVAARPRGHGLRLSFSRRANRPVTIDVFRTSQRRRVVTRQVAHLTNVRSPVTLSAARLLNGRRLRDGYYFVRFGVPTPGKPGHEYRRIALRRAHGRFTLRPPFYRRAGCGLVRSFKLQRPVFAGRTRTPLRIAFRLSRPALVSVVVRRGNRVIKRFAAAERRQDQTYRMTVPARGLRRGDYRVTLNARRGDQRVVARLMSRRL